MRGGKNFKTHLWKGGGGVNRAKLQTTEGSNTLTLQNRRAVRLFVYGSEIKLLALKGEKRGQDPVVKTLQKGGGDVLLIYKGVRAPTKRGGVKFVVWGGATVKGGTKYNIEDKEDFLLYHSIIASIFLANWRVTTSVV